ncbi:MAG: nitroreductase family protein [Bacilli bacterium]
MEVKEVFQKRRSIRSFKNEKISKEYIDLLLHAAMSGPSACNKKPWKFYVITNEHKLSELKKVTRFSSYNAPLAIVVCGDLRKALPMQLSSYWIQDCSAATENILLQATDLGLGSLWCGVHPQKRAEQNLSKLLELDDKCIPLNIIYIGYPNEEKEPRDQYDEKCIEVIE